MCVCVHVCVCVCVCVCVITEDSPLISTPFPKRSKSFSGVLIAENGAYLIYIHRGRLCLVFPAAHPVAGASDI